MAGWIKLSRCISEHWIFEDALKFNEKLIGAYGNTIMTLVGFYLDQPINLMGETGWKQTETLAVGV
jgi:hypothetical protein